MHCPFCQADDTKVIDSRLVADGGQVRRRRECTVCGERFNTYETAELAMPHVIKRDERRVPFDEEKLRTSFIKALEKRPVAVEAVDTAVNQVKNKIRAAGEREIHSEQIGEWAMDSLRELDEVAYVRFASIYRSFQDVSAFNEEIKRLQRKTTISKNKTTL